MSTHTSPTKKVNVDEESSADFEGDEPTEADIAKFLKKHNIDLDDPEYAAVSDASEDDAFIPTGPNAPLSIDNEEESSVEDGIVTTYVPAQNIVAVLEERRATDVTVLEIGHLSNWCNTFVICTGMNRRHLSALGESVADLYKGMHVEQVGGEPLVQGKGTDYLLVDGGDTLTHMMTAEERAEQDIEGLWGGDFPRILDEHEASESSD